MIQANISADIVITVPLGGPENKILQQAFFAHKKLPPDSLAEIGTWDEVFVLEQQLIDDMEGRRVVFLCRGWRVIA